MADEPSEVGNWERQQVLGSGGFGVVTLWKHKLQGNMIAIKKCRWGTDTVLTPKHKERWTNEVDIMQRLNHNSVVRALPVPPELEQALRGELPLLCMEYCSRGDLRQVLNAAENCCGLKEPTVRSLLHDVTNAVQYLHANKITHRDLKPENIVMQDDQNKKVVYKLIDLGYAKELDQSSMCASFVGTLQYLAPELFLSKKYSCTVDYWSLGLVAHEVITGVRPFLPSKTPVAWMTHVQRKSRDDICAHENEDGSIVFSSQLYPQNHISTCLQYPIERWLKLLLDWDPKRRGRASADSEELLVFSELETILDKMIIPVHCVPTAQVLSYEVDDSTELTTLQGWIARDTMIAVGDQELLMPHGSTPDPNLPAKQCLPSSNNIGDFLFVMRRGHLTLPEVKPSVPPLVGQMITDAKSPIQYVFQKKAWAHAVFFLQQEANLYRNFLRFHRAKMLHVLSGSCELGSLVQKMAKEKQWTLAQHEVFASSLATDVSTAQNVHRSNVKDLSNLWLKEGEKLLQRLDDIENRSASIEKEAEEVGNQALKLQRSPFARIRIISNLDSLVEAGQQCYEALRRRTQEQRKTPQPHTDMARVIYNCLKHRDKLLHDEPFSEHLCQLIMCQNGTELVLKPLKNCIQEFVQLRDDINRAQQQRQGDIWSILCSDFDKHSKLPALENIVSSDRPVETQPAISIVKKPADLSSKPPVPPHATPLVQSNPISLQLEPAITAAQVTHEVAHSLPILPKSDSLSKGDNLPPDSDTNDIIKANQTLRYMTQDLFNRGFHVYKDYLNSLEITLNDENVSNK